MAEIVSCCTWQSFLFSLFLLELTTEAPVARTSTSDTLSSTAAPTGKFCYILCIWVNMEIREVEMTYLTNMGWTDTYMFWLSMEKWKKRICTCPCELMPSLWSVDRKLFTFCSITWKPLDQFLPNLAEMMQSKSLYKRFTFGSAWLNKMAARGHLSFWFASFQKFWNLVLMSPVASTNDLLFVWVRWLSGTT